MMFLDYVIIAIVAALFITAFVVYRKKPHCSCGSGDASHGGCSGCSGNCAGCAHCGGSCSTCSSAGKGNHTDSSK